MNKTILTAILSFIVSANVFANSLFIDPIFDYEESENIQFATGKTKQGEMPLLLDIYTPVAKKGFNIQPPTVKPAMIFVFGGGFKSGSKDIHYIRKLSEYYVQRGYVCFAIQYRIKGDNPVAEKGPLPMPSKIEYSRLINAAVQDAAKAIRWVREHSGKFGIDPQRIGIGGVSAGAVTALYSGFLEEDILGPDTEVAAVVSYMGGLYSNTNIIDEKDPPTFIAHGEQDKLVSFKDICMPLANKLKNAGVDHAFYPVPGVAHRIGQIFSAKLPNALGETKTVSNHCTDFLYQAMDLEHLAKKNK